jgi:RNA polymerase sigma factor (sigma-70 family)
MKKYNIQNYVRYKHDMSAVLSRLPDINYGDYSRNQLIAKFLPLVENLARKFSTSQQAVGVMTINDLIQEGNYGLCAGVDRINWDTVIEAKDQEKTLKSFLSKRIKGAVRRGIDSNRGSMRIPEHKLNEIRKDFGEDKKAVELFFNSVFTSLDDGTPEQQNAAYNIPDVKTYNKAWLSAYLKALMLQHLNPKEYQVLRLSYGLDCEKHSAKEIAEILGIKGSSSYVRISQLKKLAIDKLVEKVPHSQVVDYL